MTTAINKQELLANRQSLLNQEANAIAAVHTAKGAILAIDHLLAEIDKREKAKIEEAKKGNEGEEKKEEKTPETNPGEINNDNPTSE